MYVFYYIKHRAPAWCDNNPYIIQFPTEAHYPTELVYLSSFLKTSANVKISGYDELCYDDLCFTTIFVHMIG